MTDLLFEIAELVLRAVKRALQDDADVDTTKTEATADALTKRLEEYREARKLLEAERID